MRSLRTPLCDLLGIAHPIVQAPMAGGPTTTALVAAVSGAGALGSFGHAYTSADGIAQAVADVRAPTDRPFAVNLFAAPIPEEPPMPAQRPAIEALRGRFESRGIPVPDRVPPPYAPDLAGQVEAVCAARPPIFTGHLGALPPEMFARIRGLGIRVGAAATTVREARYLESLGVDFIVAQGGEAGGHRGTFMGDPDHAMTGTLALVRLLVHAVRVPVIAAGGIMDGAGVAAALALGAQAAQLGTAFVVCAESGAPEAHKKAIAGMDGDETSIPLAFSGKLYTGFRYHRRGEQLPGEPAITAEPVPVLSECEGETSVVFLRSYMEMAAAELGQPLTDHQRAALDYFEEVAARDDVTLSFTMQPGEAIFFNNCVLLHNRTAFEDHPDPARKRHLLRLWLMLDGTRPLAPAVHAYKGTRGIVGRDGGTTYYAGEALPSANRGI